MTVHRLQKCILLLVYDVVLKRTSVPNPDDKADFANFKFWSYSLLEIDLIM